MISILDLEQKKTIIYKALSEEQKKKQLNGHVIPQQKKYNFIIDTSSPKPTHRHKHTRTL